jgi:MYXO-CTERM domain-containing protein
MSRLVSLASLVLCLIGAPPARAQSAADAFSSRVSNPHLWAATLVYLTAMALYNPERFDPHLDVLPPIDEAGGAGCGCRTARTAPASALALLAALWLLRRRRRRPTGWWRALTPALLLAVVGCGGGEECVESPILVTASSTTVSVWERLELTAADIGLAPANPFDPAEVAVEGEFRGPDRRSLTVPGFAHQGFTRELVGGAEVLTPQGDRSWKVRFAPIAPGDWQWRVKVRSGGACQATPWATVTATPPAAGRHGFVRPSARDPRYLAHDDGTPYFAVGENLAWADARGTFAYDDWLAKLAANGATYVRLWMPSWGFGLEAIERDAAGAVAASTLGDYGGRLDRAWALDHVLERAHEHGLAVMLCLQNHGELSTSMNSEWEDSPYNAANGGPLATADAFFTDDTARALFKRRLRYVVARWGHSPAVLAWELFNEVDLTDQLDRDVQAAWHTEMATYLKSIDAFGHPVTTSVSGLLGPVLGMDQTLFSLPDIDLAQFHMYGAGGMDVDFTTEMPTVAAGLRAHGKPVLAAEVGVDYRGVPETLQRDPQSLGFHDSLWMGLFAETAGSGMTWWWDGLIDPRDLYGQIGAVAGFVSGVAFDEEGFAGGGAPTVADGRALSAWALRGQRVVLVWVKDLDTLWFKGGDAVAVTGASLTLAGLAAGEWRAVWHDPYASWTPVEAAVTVAGAEVTLAVPDFTRDVAVRLDVVQ